MIDGLGGVLIYTAAERFAAMRSFYVEVLGLDPRSDRSGFVNFELGDQRLTVAVHSALAGPNPSPEHMMVNLLVDDIRPVYAGALERGARSLRPPETESWGGLVATLQDPDDNIIQLMQLPV
jgi:predicted enzyme related to lactoylglutathione lyase